MLLAKTIRLLFSSTVRFAFIRRDGSRLEVEAEKGKHILEIAKANGVELEGAC